MSRSARRWILLCLALLLTVGATYSCCMTVGAALGDVFGPPGSSQLQRQQARAAVDYQADTYAAETVVFLILAALSLGTAFRRDNWKHSVAAYVAAFLACPLISALLTYAVISLS